MKDLWNFLFGLIQMNLLGNSLPEKWWESRGNWVVPRVWSRGKLCYWKLVCQGMTRVGLDPIVIWKCGKGLHFPKSKLSKTMIMSTWVRVGDALGLWRGAAWLGQLRCEEGSYWLKVLGCIGIFFVGLMSVSALIVEEVIPPWLFPLCLLPIAIFLDHFFSSGTPPRKKWKYSTTGGVLCLTLFVFFLMEFEEFRKYFLIILAVVFIVPMLFAPELLAWHLWSRDSEKKVQTHEKSPKG